MVGHTSQHSILRFHEVVAIDNGSMFARISDSTPSEPSKSYIQSHDFVEKPKLAKKGPRIHHHVNLVAGDLLVFKR